MEGHLDNKNRYNDKELIDDGDLNWYDYGFRNYDPQIGRFIQLDPLTWDYPELTNYQYASNEPIKNIDLDGLEGVDFKELLPVTVSTPFVSSISFASIARIAIPAISSTVMFSYTNGNNESFLSKQYFGPNHTLNWGKDATGKDWGKTDYTYNGTTSIESSHYEYTDRTSVAPTVQQTEGKLQSLRIYYNYQHTFVYVGSRYGNIDIYKNPSGDVREHARPEALGNDELGSQAIFALATGGASAEAEAAVEATEGVQYTKSSMTLGRAMHAEYKLAEHAPELMKFKEFRDIPGIRPDFVDFNTKTIFELKPFNPRAMNQGMNQLNKYKSLFEQNYGGTWNTVLDTY